MKGNGIGMAYGGWRKLCIGYVAKMYVPQSVDRVVLL